jgi:hypothetical protein
MVLVVKASGKDILSRKSDTYDVDLDCYSIRVKVN